MDNTTQGCFDNEDLTLRKCVETAREAKEPYFPSEDGFRTLVGYVMTELEMKKDNRKWRDEKIEKLTSLKCPQIIIDNENRILHETDGMIKAYGKVLDWMYKVSALGDIGLTCLGCVEHVLYNLQHEGCYTCRFCIYEGKGQDIIPRCLLQKREDLFMQNPENPETPEDKVMCGPCDSYMIDDTPVKEYEIDAYDMRDEKTPEACSGCKYDDGNWSILCDDCRAKRLATKSRQKRWKRNLERLGRMIGV